MGYTKNLMDRVQMFNAATAPDRVGKRYDGSKTIAINRYIAAVAPFVTVRELTRSILERNGVPAALHGSYYGFAMQLVKAAQKHFDKDLDNIVSGLKAEFATRGLDPTILDAISKLIA